MFYIDLLTYYTSILSITFTNYLLSNGKPLTFLPHYTVILSNYNFFFLLNHITLSFFHISFSDFNFYRIIPHSMRIENKTVSVLLHSNFIFTTNLGISERFSLPKTRQTTAELSHPRNHRGDGNFLCPSFCSCKFLSFHFIFLIKSHNNLFKNTLKT